MKIVQQLKCLLVFLLILASYPIFSNLSTIDSCLVAIQSFPFSSQDKPYAALLLKTGTAFYEDEKYDISVNYFFQSLDISRSEQYHSLTFHSFKNLGDAFFWQSEYDSSIVYLNKALDFSGQFYPLTLVDSVKLFKSFGNSYYYMGHLEKAYQYRMKVLSLNQIQGNELALADSFYALAELDNDQKKYKEALEKLSQSLQIYQAKGRVEDAGYCYDLMSHINFEKGEYEKALEFMNLACEGNLENKSQYHIGHCAHNLGKIYAKLGEFETSIKYFNQALLVRKNSNQKEELVQTLSELAELKMLNGKCYQAKKILEECLKKPITRKVSPIRRDIYQKMYQVSFQCKNYKLAYVFQKKYFDLRDSLASEMTKKELSNLSSIFELDQKKQEVTLLKKDQELTNLFYWFISAAFLLLTGIVVIGSWFYKKQYFYNFKLKDQKEKIEEQNQALFNSNEKLKIANVELENFAYIASHDLKAPLRTVISYTGLIEKRYTKVLDQNGLEFLKLITDSVEHMHQLLDDVLSYSNVEKQEDNFQPIDLNNMVDKVLQTLQLNIKEQDAIIKYDDLPVVLGNQIQIFQVFQNLIGNAIKFVSDDCQAIIEINFSERNGRICIAIKDNGIGIEERYQERIFSLFKRLHNSKEYKGTGLGLSICKKIIEKHGGEIWVESDGKSGATFCFTLENAEINQEVTTSELEMFYG